VTANGARAGDVNLRASGQMTSPAPRGPDGQPPPVSRSGWPRSPSSRTSSLAAILQQVANLPPCPGAPVWWQQHASRRGWHAVAPTPATHFARDLPGFEVWQPPKGVRRAADDGNTVEGDGCDSNCTTSRQRHHRRHRECDDGQHRRWRRLRQQLPEGEPRCGDSDVQPPEQATRQHTRCDGCDRASSKSAATVPGMPSR
jgi:hypothetical protein